jgi:uncharacterized protein
MRLLYLLATVLMLSSCANLSISGMGKNARVTEQDARGLHDDGQFAAAAEAYLRLASTDSSRKAVFKLMAAENFRLAGDMPHLQKTLASIKAKQLDQAAMARMDLLRAEMAMDNGRADEALDFLTLDQRVLPSEFRSRFHELKARALGLQGRYLDAATERAAFNSSLAEIERQDNEYELKKLLAQVPIAERQTQLRTLQRKDALYPWLLKSGVRDNAKPLSFAEDLALQDSAFDRAPDAAQNFIDLPRERFTKVALLLPLSGTLAPAGQAIRDGILAAYFADSAEKPELFIVDSGESPEAALRAYEQAKQAGADAILGPFPREQVSALFQAENIEIPVLALNVAEAPALPPRGSLQFGLLPEEEAINVADHIYAIGLRNMAVLTPKDDLGARAANAFVTRFESLGGHIATRAEFDPSNNDFSAPVRIAVGASESSQRSALVRTITGVNFSFQPSKRSDIDGLFLLARPPQARLLLPNLRLFDAMEWPIFATSHIYGGGANNMDNDLNGVQFCDSPWVVDGPLPASVASRKSVAGLTSSQGPGGRLFAFGMDAWQLLMHITWFDRNAAAPIAGATGDLASDGRGSVRRRLHWATFGSGRAHSSAP